MADLVVGLAKSVVEGALTKAQAAIEEEAKLRRSAQRDLVFITGEFEMMHSFLKVAKVERVENEVVRTWVRQVRELAYDVEDCIEFVIHLDKTTSWWIRMIPSWCSALPLPLDEAVDEIEQLKSRVVDVSTRNARYRLISDTGSKPAIVQQQEVLLGAAVATTKVNMLAEARGATKRNKCCGDLTRLITKMDNDVQVISVWGADGDHGTTSIIRKTYNQPGTCRKFNYRAWVKLMHPFSPHDFVRSVMAQFYANFCNELARATIGMHVLTKMETTQEDLFLEFERLVTEERYLVVMEGLSNMVDWDAIRTFLPSTINGSWIIVSTQQPEIASLCVGHSYRILELKRFSDEHSVCALFKASQGDGDKDIKPTDSQGDRDKGKKPMEYDVNRSISINDNIMSPNREAFEEWITSPPLVGRESRINELGKFADKARLNSPPVMSVWGIAGVGKSALVKSLFCDRMHTDIHEKYYWVDVSHPFNSRDLYLNLLSDFHSEKDPIEECHRLLEYRCLVVIDDVRSTKEWDLIQASLVSKQSRSVIIVITTEQSIAKYCTNDEDLVFNVKALEAADASKLFENQVLKKNPSSSLNVQDGEVQELILKCGGIPKVITAVATLLATKEKTMDIVRSLSPRYMHHLETDPEYDSLRDLFGWMHSYFRTCPDSLKPCIFYLSIFPRDHIIRRRRLVRRWIAEGYSRDSHNESAEENGEKHFSELLELSIIQRLSSHPSSSASSSAFNVDTVRMVRCQVNSFIREYIVSRRMEENLVFELGDKCAFTTQRTGRHLVILENWHRDTIVFKSIDFSRLRSLTVFGKWESYFISDSMKMLRVLDLEDASGLNDADLDKMVEWLRRLKFLSIRGHREINHLPSSLDHMRQLQTLDIRDTTIVTLPESITKLHKLQYIRAGINDDPPVSSSWFRRRRLVGVEVLGGIGKLTALHTLGVVNIGASGAKNMVKELKKLTQLRKLGVSGINRKNIKDFGKLVHDAHLESLSIQLDKDNEGCLERITFPWMHLRSLKLYGLGDKLPESIKVISKLKKVDLEMGTLGTNDIEFLGSMPKLSVLRLRVKQSSIPKTNILQTNIPETIIPHTNIPETNIPQTTIPETNIPHTNIPQTNIQETNILQTNIPETNIPETNIPETDIPQTIIPETNIPETDIPHTIIPETNIPETNIPRTNIPDTNIPETDIPHTNILQTNIPETNIPETNIPQTNISETNITETNILQTNIPETNIPQTNIPETNIPQTNIPETNIPETKIPQTNIPQTNIPETNIPETNILQTNIPEMNIPDTDIPELIFSAHMSGLEVRSYENIKILEISCSYSSSRSLKITFGSEAMTNLEVLKLDYSSGSSYKFSGIEHLSKLKQVFLMGTNDETLKAGLQSEFAVRPKLPIVELEPKKNVSENGAGEAAVKSS